MKDPSRDPREMRVMLYLDLPGLEGKTIAVKHVIEPYTAQCFYPLKFHTLNMQRSFPSWAKQNERSEELKQKRKAVLQRVLLQMERDILKWLDEHDTLNGYPKKTNEDQDHR